MWVSVCLLSRLIRRCTPYPAIVGRVVVDSYQFSDVPSNSRLFGKISISVGCDYNTLPLFLLSVEFRPVFGGQVFEVVSRAKRWHWGNSGWHFFVCFLRATTRHACLRCGMRVSVTSFMPCSRFMHKSLENNSPDTSFWGCSPESR